MIIGVTGTIGAGKGTFSSYLMERHDFFLLAFGSEVRKELQGKRIAENREVLQRLGFELRDELAERIGGQIEANRNYVIDGFRYPKQVDIVRRYSELDLVAIDALEEIRFKRLERRGREGDPKTWEEFWIQNGRDWIGYLDGSGQDVRGCFKIASRRIDNNDGLEDFKQRIEEFIRDYS